MAKLLVITQKVDKNDQLLGFFIEWLKRFSGRFEKITVLCLQKGEFDLPENVEVLSLGKDRGYSKIRQLSTFYFLLSTLEYDSVFVHMNPIWVVLGGSLWRLMGKKIFFWYTSGGVTPKLKLAEKLADIIFTASKESFRLPSKKVIVTGHGIDTELFKPNLARLNLQDGASRFDLGEMKILSVGRISPVKNYGTLIDAVKILKDHIVRHPMSGISNIVVTIAGESAWERDKEYEAKLKLQITNYQLQNHFNFIGKIDHQKLPELYRSHDIFVHLSKTGSLDKAILEAIACGMKVLSSNDSSRAFLPGNLIFKENDPADLATKLAAIKNSIADQKLREYVVQRHNLDQLINKISGIITS